MCIDRVNVLVSGGRVIGAHRSDGGRVSTYSAWFWYTVCGTLLSQSQLFRRGTTIDRAYNVCIDRVNVFVSGGRVILVLLAATQSV